MSHRAAVHQLEADFADAMNRMYTVGNGLARLRGELDRESASAAGQLPPLPVASVTAPTTSATASGMPVTSTSQPVPGGPPLPPGPLATPPWSVPPPPPGAFPASGGPAQPVPPPPSWYRREGAVTRVLALAGAIVTLAGIAMLLVLAVQQGWFGPVPRVLAGAALAAVLVGLGVRTGETERRTQRVGSAPVALVATGAAAAYLDVVAVTTAYGWVPPVVGLLLAGVVALGGLQLARRWDSELLAVLMVLGAAALAPVVAQDFGWVVSAFLAVLAAAGWWAGGDRTRPVLTLARTVPVTLSLLAGAVGSPAGGSDSFGHLAVAVALLLATLGGSALSVRRDPGDVTSSVALGLVATAALVCAAPLAQPGRTIVLVLASAVLLLAATALGRAPVGPVAGHLVATAGVAGTVAAVLAVVSGAPDRFVTTGLVLLALGQLAVAGVTRQRLTLVLAAGATAVALIAWAQHPLAVTALDTARRHDLVAALVDSVLVGLLVLVGAWATGNQRGVAREVRLAVTILAWVVGLSASATGTVALATALGERVGEPTLGFTTGHGLATVTWMVGAAWLLLRGLERSRDADLTLRIGLLVSAVSVAKLFLYDLAALSGIVRSVAFIVTGLLLLGTGSLYAKAYERSRLGT